ncbi:beta/gamma crystallin family protein, partial [Klebsiella pneumoniae]|nr:beta/gamma crystallin family protein [Klebsiella pneumoniae]
YVTLYEKENGQGEFFGTEHSASDLPTYINKKASSVKIYEKQGVWLVEEINFKKGEHGWDERLFGDNRVGNANINYRVSSIK